MGAEAMRLGWGIANGKKPDQPIHLLEPSLVNAANAASGEGRPQSE